MKLVVAVSGASGAPYARRLLDFLARDGAAHGVSADLVFTQTGNTNALRVESVRLGLVAGTNASSTGTAYVDAFQSTRYTLP